MPLSPATVFEFDRSDWLTFTSTVTGNRIRGLATNTKNTGASPVMVEDPLNANGATVMRLSTPVQNDMTEVALEAGYHLTGEDITALHNEVDEGYFLFRFCGDVKSANGADVGVMRMVNGIQQILKMHMVQNGKIEFEFNDSTNITSSTIIIDTTHWFTCLIYWKASSGSSDGDFRFWLSQESEAREPINSFTEVGSLRYQNHNITIKMNQFLMHNKKFTVHSGKTFDMYYAFMRYFRMDDFNKLGISGNLESAYDVVNHRDGMLGQLKDGDSDAISVKVWGHPGRFRDNWTGVADLKAKLWAAPGTTWPGDGDSSLIDLGEVALDPAVWYQNHLMPTGLRQYGHEFRMKVAIYRSSVPAEIYWPTRTLEVTLQPRSIPDDLSSAFRLVQTYCNDQSATQPYHHYRQAHEKGITDGLVMLGDAIYESPTASDNAYFMTEEECYLEYFKVETESELAEWRRKHFEYVLADDHEKFNNCTAASRKGFIETNFMGVGLNPTGADGKDRAQQGPHWAQGQTIHKGDLWDAAQKAWYHVASKGFLNSPYTNVNEFDRVDFRQFKWYPLKMAMVDMRFWRDDQGDEATSGGNITIFGAGQKEWLKQEVIADPKCEYLIICGQAPWSDVLTAVHGDEHFVENFTNEWYEIIKFIQDQNHLRAVWLINGDIHFCIGDRRFFDGVRSLDFTANKIIYEQRFGPVGKHRAPGDSTFKPPDGVNSRGVDVYYNTGLADNSIVRIWGEFCLNANGRTSEHRAYLGDDGTIIADIGPLGFPGNHRGGLKRFRTRAGAIRDGYETV